MIFESIEPRWTRSLSDRSLLETYCDKNIPRGARLNSKCRATRNKSRSRENHLF